MPPAPLLKEKEEGKPRVLEKGALVVGLLPDEGDPCFRGHAGKGLEVEGAFLRAWEVSPPLSSRQKDEEGTEGGVAAFLLPVLVNRGVHDLVIGGEKDNLPFLALGR